MVLSPLFSVASFLPQHEVNHPAAANVNLLGIAAVVEHLVIVAASVLKCIRENRHGAELSRLVHLFREGNGGVCAPRWGERDRVEGVAEDVTQYRCLVLAFF